MSKYTINIIQREDYRLDLFLKTGTGCNAPALNLTGHNVRAEIRKAWTGPLVIAFTTLVVSPATDGNIRLTLTGDQTFILPPGELVYDVFITETATSKRTRVLYGNLNVTAAITRSNG
jgi:hypothetical protein